MQVPNVVPSISAVTGGFTPERYVWRLGMAFFSSPRIFDSFLMYNFFAASSAAKQRWYSILNKINWFCYVAENLSLFTLSYVSSVENYRELITVCRCVAVSSTLYLLTVYVKMYLYQVIVRSCPSAVQ